MSSIDQRIVEMQFDNKQFESGIRTSLKSLASLKKGLNLDESAKSLDKLKKAGKDFSLASIATGIDTITRRFSAMGIAGITVMQRLTNAAITTGKRITSALTIDPVRSGLQEYETQINAIQTIMSNTRKEFANDAEALKAVNSALDELNAYADKTIYNFTEMTRNIGTFTAAGVKLETSTAAIKGIANLAAVSGSTSQQASTAMYQLSQALASGTVRLMDWNSLVNAGMGGKVLQDALMETARVHDINIDKMIEKEGSFRETLQKGWLTSEIMLETLQKFTGDLTKEQILAMGYTEKQAEEIIALGKDANNAATKVKTFTQLIDTLKEALGSGWAQSWEYIIGNFEEARTLWTNVSDAISKVIGDNADARNELLKGWHDAGGRDDLIQGLFDAFQGLWGIIKAIGSAMREIFPETTVEDLLAISSAVKEFGSNLKKTFGYVEGITGFTTIETTIEGIAKAINLTRDLKKGLKGDDVAELQKRLNELGFDAGKEDGIFGKKTRKALKAFEKEYGLTVDGIFSESDNLKLAEVLGLTETKTAFEKVAQYTTYFSDALEKVKRVGKGAFAVFDIGRKIISAIGSAFKIIGKALSPLGNALLEIAAAFGDWLVGINETLEKSGKLETWISNFETAIVPFAEKIEKISQSLLAFFGLGDAVNEAGKELLTFKQIVDIIKKVFSGETKLTDDIFQKPFDAIKKFLETVKAKFDVVKDWVKTDLTEILGGFNILGTVAALVAIALFSNIMAAVNQFKKIGKNINKLVKSIKDVVGGFNKKTFSFNDAASSVLKIAAAVSLLASVVYVFSKMDVKSIMQGLASIMAVLAMLVLSMVAFNYASKGFKDPAKTLGSLLSLSAAVAILSASVFALGKIDIKSLTKGIAGLGAVLLELSVFMLIAGKAGKVKNSLGIAVISASLLLMVKAIKQLGSIDERGLIRGIAGLGAVLLELAVFMAIANHVGGGIGTATEILAMAGALEPIVTAIKDIGTIDTAVLLKGIAGLGAVLLELALFTKLAGQSVSISTSIAILSVVAAITILSRSIQKIGSSDGKTIARGIAAVTIILIEFGLFMRALGTIKPSVRSMLGLLPAAVALDLLLLVFVVVAKNMSGLNIETLIKGLITFTGVMLSFGIFMKALGAIKPNVKAMLGMIPAALALSGIIIAFAFAVNKIKDVNTTKIDSFAKGLSTLVTAFGLAVTAMGFAGFGGIAAGLVGIVGIVAVIGGIIAAFGALRKIDGFQEFMNGGAESIGQILGAFVGSFQASKLAALTKGLSDFSGVSIDQDGLTDALAAIQMISDFEKSLPDQSVGQKIADFFLGSNLENFSDDVTAFAKSANTLAETMDGVEIDTSKVQVAVDAAGLINGLAVAIGTISIEEGLAQLVTGDSPFGVFCGNMGAFADSISYVSGTFDNITLDLNDVKLAVSAAELINGLSTAIGTISVSEAIAQLIAGDSAFGVFCSNMSSFGSSISNMHRGVSGLSDSNIENDTKAAAGAANAVAELIEAISGMNIEKNKSAIEKFFTGDGKVDTVFSKIGTLGTTIADAASKFEGTADSSLVDDTEAVKESVTTLANFLMWLSGDDVYIDYSGESSGYNLSNFDNLMDQMAQIGMKISEFSEHTKDVDTEKFTSLIDGVKSIASSAAGLAEEGLSDDRVNEVLAGLTKLGTGLMQALSSGFADNEDGSAIDLVVGGMLGAIDEYDDDFEAAGADMSRGLASGMRKSSYIAAAAAIAVAKAALAAAKKALGIASPSKEFEAFGMYSDEGFAAGLIRYSGVVKQAAEGIGYSALSGLRQTLDNLSTVINNDIDTTPVIRPVMDLSNVASGAQAINGMLSGTSRIGYMGTSSRILAGSIDKTTKEYQNGSGNTNAGGTITNDNSINFAGANFNVRSEQDIHSLANEIAVLSVSQQRALGAAITK